MPKFEFEAKKPDGSNISGEVEAAKSQEVLDLLVSKNLFPVSVTQKRKGIMDAMQASFTSGVKVKDLVIFSRQLAVMSAAALPLVQALRIMVDQTESPGLKNAIIEVSEDVDGGEKFSVALGRHSKIFSNFFIAMIRSGETSGRLDDILNYLADQQEKDYDLMSKIKGAMIYPAFIVVGLIVVGIVMMIFVVPRLTSILTESGVELPITTKILIAVSGFLAGFWWLVILLAALGFIGFKFLLKSKQGRQGWDALKIRVPVFGKLFQRIYLVRMTRSLSTLLQGGVPLPKALTITSDVVSNATYRDLLLDTKKEVDDGNPVSTILLKSRVVPPMVSQMMSVGEQTGRLDQILERLTDFYAREIENLVGNLVSLIEPMVMVLLGLAVGVMVAAIILPMYSLATSV